jgi:chitinase
MKDGAGMSPTSVLTPEQRAAAAPLDPLTLPVRPPRRLAWGRVVAVVVVAALAVAGAWWVANRPAAASAAASHRWFAPYVDATNSPRYAFEDPVTPDARNIVLSFIVAAPGAACTPSWGGVYSLDSAAEGLDMDRRIARLRQRGGTISVSFGGAANDELANTCADPVALAAAYQSVIQRYALTRIDLDIETPAALDPAVLARRAAALATVQRTMAATKTPLSIWLTLPVAPTGLVGTGVAAVDSMLAAGVDLAGVNVMTMDYGGSRPAGESMGGAAIDALKATEPQLVSAYQRHGVTLTADQAWAKLGATPMVGQNDVPDEVFTVDDAKQLADFAAQHDLGRLSFWSLNRDVACGPNYVDISTVSNNCSGVGQDAAGFSQDLGAFAAGSAAPAGSLSATASAADASGSGSASGIPLAGSNAPTDDPATSPYPIWAAVKAYAKGDKVVWHRNVYQAKWYTQGDTPDLPVANLADTPWQLIGPVLPGEHPAPLPTLPAGTYPDWSASATYTAGQRVLYQGVGYEAKWWTQADVPGADVLSPADTPWAQLAADGTTDGPTAPPSDGPDS